MSQSTFTSSHPIRVLSDSHRFHFLSLRCLYCSLRCSSATALICSRERSPWWSSLRAWEKVFVCLSTRCDSLKVIPHYHSLRSTSRSIFLIWLTLSSTSLSLSTRCLRLSMNESSCFRPAVSSFVSRILLSMRRFWMSSYLKFNRRWCDESAGSVCGVVSVSSMILIASLYVSIWNWSSRFSAEWMEMKFPCSFVEWVNPWIPNPALQPKQIGSV